MLYHPIIRAHTERREASPFRKAQVSALHLLVLSYCLTGPICSNLHCHTSRSFSYHNWLGSIASGARIAPSDFLPMASPDSRQLAKELVKNIAKKKGYLAEETLQYITNSEARREIEDVIRSISAQNGLSIITHVPLTPNF